MADGNTHIYFGLGVLGAMAPDLRQRITRDMDAFYLGLQGPDPLIFDPRTQKEARRFHKVWEGEALPRLVRAMREGEPSESSFAAGGYLHFVLDDIVHPLIWAWMKEGSSHMRLELALDYNILAEEGIKKMPRLFTEGKYRVAPYAHLMLPGAQANHYLTGLRTMQLTIDYLRRRQKPVMAKVTEAEAQQVLILRGQVDGQILPVAERLSGLLSREKRETRKGEQPHDQLQRKTEGTAGKEPTEAAPGKPAGGPGSPAEGTAGAGGAAE